ncbi:hypothetical protein MAR_003339 [Mya arenaria]|uniref:Uncharacterized protein n=1 Tax=Mya arenaria TaxID=6604 RepID=A0ABY7GF04_MYAAR|nr:hypothetical protein MAR_003339 [Mya arenaria]
MNEMKAAREENTSSNFGKVISRSINNHNINLKIIFFTSISKGEVVKETEHAGVKIEKRNQLAASFDGTIEGESGHE